MIKKRENDKKYMAKCKELLLLNKWIVSFKALIFERK